MLAKQKPFVNKNLLRNDKRESNGRLYSQKSYAILKKRRERYIWKR